MYDWIGRITSDERSLDRLARICGWLPRFVMLWSCSAAALLLYMLSGKGLRSRVQGNMRDLLDERSERKLSQWSHRFYRNVVLALYEILLESRRLEGSAGWRFKVEGEHRLKEALQLGRGAIVYTPHVGNFFYYYWYLCRHYSCLTVATGGSPELRPLYLKFLNLGCPGLDYDSTPPLELYRRLKKHLASGGVVFLLGDFWRPAFPASRFFGRRTRMPEGAAMLSIEQEVPVIPFYGYRERGFKHRLLFEEPLHLYSSFTRATRTDATNVLNRFMERVIRQQPDAWFYWFNAEERWEKDPEAAEPDSESTKMHTA